MSDRLALFSAAMLRDHAAALSEPSRVDGPSSGRRNRWLLPTALAVALIGGLVMFLNKGTSELPVYVTAADRLLADQRMHVPQDDKPFTYPPFFAVPFVPFTWLPGEALQRTVWYLLNVLAVWWIVRVLRRRLGPLVPPGASGWFWGLTAALSLRHVSAVLENQSHDLLVFAVLIAGWEFACRSRWWRTALCAGLGAAMKATPLLFLPFLLLRRHWLAAALVPVTFLVASFVPEWFGHSDSGEPYLVDWYRTFLSGMNPIDPDAPATAQSEGAWQAWNYLNQSLGGTLHRLFTPVEPGLHRVNVALFELSPRGLKLLTQVAQALLLVGGALLLGWRARDARALQLDERLGATFGLILCGMVLLSPMSSKSHFCVLLLPYAVLALSFVRFESSPTERWLLLLVAALNWLTMRGVLPKAVGTWLLAAGAVTWITLLTAVLLGWRLLAWRRAAAATAAQPASAATTA